MKSAQRRRTKGKTEFPNLVAPAHLPGSTVAVVDLKKEAERRLRGFDKELLKIRGSIDDTLVSFDRAWKHDPQMEGIEGSSAFADDDDADAIGAGARLPQLPDAEGSSRTSGPD